MCRKATRGSIRCGGQREWQWRKTSYHYIELKIYFLTRKSEKKPPQGQGEPVVAGVVRDTPTREWIGVPLAEVINKQRCRWQ